MKNNGCVGCHQLGQLSTRTLPEGIGQHSSSVEAWVRRVSSGQSGEQMVTLLAGQLGGVPFKYFADWTDRVAKGELPHTKPTRPQGQERNIVVTTWDWGTAEALSPRPDRVRPALPDRQRLWSGVRLARIFDRRVADPRSEDAHRDVFQCAGGGQDDRHGARPGPCGERPPGRAVALLGHGADLGYHAPTTTTPCSTATAGSGSRRADAARKNPDFCKKGSDHPSAKAFPVRDRRTGSSRCWIRRR